MGILQSIKNKLSKKSKKKILTAEEVAKICVAYEEEVKLLSHAVEVTKPEDKAYFASRAQKLTENFPRLEEEIKLAKEKADKDVEDFLETGDDILAHYSQEYYDDLLADWRAESVMISMAYGRLQAANNALSGLQAFFEGKTNDYNIDLVTKIAAADSKTVETLLRNSKRYAADEVAALDKSGSGLDSGVLSTIGKAASIATMGMGIANGDAAQTVTGAALYHLNNQTEKNDGEGPQPE